MTRRMALGMVVAIVAAACEITTATPSPSFAPEASPSRTTVPAAAGSASPVHLPPEVAMWCRQNVHDVYAVTEGLGIPSDPRPFRLVPEDDRRWTPVEASRNYQVGCTAAYEERASVAPS